MGKYACWVNQLTQHDNIIYFLSSRDPNSGTRKLPITVDNVTSLPSWSQYSDSKEEFLDLESFSKVSVKTKLREKHCKFLADPENFVTKPTSGSGGNVRGVKSIWFFMAAVCIFRIT